MSNETRHFYDISKLLGDYYGDPACNVCIVLFLMTMILFNGRLLFVLGLEHDADEIAFTESAGFNYLCQEPDLST